MNRYEQRMAELDQRGEGAFVPFVVVGDPNPEDSLAIIRELIVAGADALELGLPFSDPVADGPVIQQAMTRALRHPHSTSQYLEWIGEIRRGDPQIPIGLLVYANLIMAFGIDAFYSECKRHGVDSVLVADVPLVECQPFCEAAHRAAVDPVLLYPPNIDAARLQLLARWGRGYTYLLSRAGVTGTHAQAGRPIESLVAQLRQLGAPPPYLGFGIAGPADVRAAIAAGVRGVICGSAIVERMSQNLPDVGRVTNVLAHFVSDMKAATRRLCE